MITTEPNELVGAVHDRMPAVLVLGEEQIGPFLSGELEAFGTSTVALQFKETHNFLKRDPKRGDLF